jgi:hypothetical protein
MKRSLASLTLLCAVCCMAVGSLAQQPPENRPEPREPRPGGEGRPRDEGRPREEGRPRDGESRPEGRPRDGEGIRPEARREAGRPGMPEGVTPEMIRLYMQQQRPSPQAMQVDAMRSYLDVFDRYSRLSRDPASSGIAAVVTAGEVLRARGADAGINYFTKVLPEVKNDAVQRAIRLQLIELYKMSGQQDKALEQLQQLMVSAPEGGMERPRPEGGDGGPRPRQN